MTAFSPNLMARPDCAACPIRHRAVCARCEADELAQLEKIKIYRSWKAGETILFDGDPMDFVGSVVTGCAMLTRRLEDGRSQMVGLLMPSDFLGRPGRSTAPYEVSAATDLTLCMFRRAPFEKLLVEVPHIRDRLLEMSLDELDAAREWMVLLGRKTAREKVATLLLLVLRRSSLPISGVARADLPITREAMASYLGLTIETVSRQMSRLRADGVITLEGLRKVSAPDLEALALAAGEDSDGATIA
ncbi:Nitrogen fixation regulation protein FixK [Jannaschia seosinensis]|uniref:Nitrogen fixation regulation protein FixK n=1 Tax=Jannaschia seosinensis TaxID=313367 RepID=A0A0M7B427_9RHOB|nr:Crp/Fnr family transcriptional regulator [Jannaschia seosinensis]CUH12953.1 Nitrogen fixation regulation protein FixK [Jannaschia seosinensis]